jgi:hypothetical protein
MTDTLSADYVKQALEAQGCTIEVQDAAAIAVNVAMQLDSAQAAYAALAFEAEPSLFAAALNQGATK